jgi:adenylylsulfate kinase
MTDEPGTVIWITGLPGSGKTTIGSEVVAQLRVRTPAVVMVDGDMVREVMGDLGYGMADRLENARRISRLCQLLSRQGLHVVCSTVSLFRERHDWNRANLPRYLEVLVQVRWETLVARDKKGLYSGAAAGTATDVLGVDQQVEMPAAPDLVIDNDEGGASPAESAARIVARVAA